MVNWRKDVKDTMWSMFWMNPSPANSDIEADKSSIVENIARIIRLTTQKTAGQRHAKADINWDVLEHTVLSIVCSATSLALQGYFGDMPDEIEP